MTLWVTTTTGGDYVDIRRALWHQGKLSGMEGRPEHPSAREANSRRIQFPENFIVPDEQCARLSTHPSAIQLYAENGVRPTQVEWVRDNHVEEQAEGEIENLEILTRFYKEHPRRRLEADE